MSWEIETSEQFIRDAKVFAKKHPNETNAMMANLSQYLDALQISKNPALVQLGFLHNEAVGVRAIDQRGGISKGGPRPAQMKETRLYTYSDLKSKKLHLICIGDKVDQKKEVNYSKRFVEKLREKELGGGKK